MKKSNVMQCSSIALRELNCRTGRESYWVEGRTRSERNAGTLDGELGTKVTRVAEQDELIVAALDDERDLDLNAAEEDVKVVGEDQGSRQVSLAEEDHPDFVGDLGGGVGGVPSNIVRLSGDPDGACMRVRHRRGEDVAGRERHSGRVGRSGEEGGEEGGAGEFHCEGRGW